VLAPNLEITGEDDLFRWYYRAQFGAAAEKARRDGAWAWSWHLTRLGYRDDEIQIALFSKAAGTSLAWIARLRGIVVHDHRIAAAIDALAEAERAGALTDHRARAGALDRWRGAPRGVDLDAEASALLSAVGDRTARVDGLARIAREHYVRGAPAAGDATVMRALEEARAGGAGALDAALVRLSSLWAAR
jgi:hypothetical protein